MNKETRATALNKLEDMKKEMERLEAIIKAPEKALRLEVIGCGDLNIIYGDQLVGYINLKGNCRILNNNNRVDAYSQWREDGQNIDSSVVEWRGGKYMIDGFGYLTRNDDREINIYSFKDCVYCACCQDTNIKRHAHNNRAIGY